MSLGARAALVCLLALGGCDQLPGPLGPVAAPEDYRPGEAGTVDYALCLLGFTAVPLRELRTGHHLVDVTLNGREATFVLDTGANVTVLDAGLADEFGLTPRRGVRGAAFGLGGALEARQWNIETLRVGEVDVRQGQIVTADLTGVMNTLGRVSNVTISGIVGQDVMQAHNAVIDVAGHVLYLIPEGQRLGPVPAERCGPQGRAEDAAPG